MKHLLLYSCLYIGGLLPLAAQTQNGSGCWHTENTLSTDWRNSASPNTWNWTTPGQVHPVYLTAGLNQPSVYIELPYFCSQAPGSGSCGPNTLLYEFAQPHEQDIWPEDGWELVIKNFGTPNSSPNLNDGNGVSNPYFILYNRYTGRLKTYIALMGVQAANAAYIKIGFVNGINNDFVFRDLLAHAQPAAHGLEDFDPSLTFTTLNQVVVKNSPTDWTWMLSEIQTAFDPCTCHLPQGQSRNSLLNVKLETATVSTIEASLDGSVRQYLLAQNGAVTPEGNKKTSMLDISIAAGKAGIAAYNSWDSYRSEANTIFNKFHQQYKDKVAKQWFNQTMRPFYTGVYSDAEIEQLYKEFMSSDEGHKRAMGVTGLDKYGYEMSKLKGLASSLPYIGATIGVIDFLFIGGKKTYSPPLPPAPPLTFNVALKLKGSITSPLPKTNFDFLNPGSAVAGTPNPGIQPMYNNVLGVFNILKLPELEYSVLDFNYVTRNFIKALDDNQYRPMSIEDGLVVAPLSNPAELESLLNGINACSFRQYHPKNVCKYLVNPASHLEVEMIDACLQLEYRGTQKLYMHDANDFISGADIPEYQGMFEPSFGLKQRIESLENEGLFLDYLSADYPSNPESIIRLRTDYVPLSCLQNLNLLMFGNGQVKPQITLKLLIKYKRKDETNAEPVTQVVSYNMNGRYGTATFDKLVNSGLQVNRNLLFDQIKREPEAYEFKDIFMLQGPIAILGYSNFYRKYADTLQYNPLFSISGNTVSAQTMIIPDNTVFLATQPVIHASNDVIVGKNIVWASNTRIAAGNSIQISPEANIPPGVELLTLPRSEILFNCNPDADVANYRATDEEIMQLCQASAQYLNGAGFGKRQDEWPQAGQGTEKEPAMELDMYPNPAHDLLYISYLSHTETAELLIYNLLGQQLHHSRLPASGESLRQESLNIQALAPGVYLAELRCGSSHIQQKLIKF